MTAIDTSNPLTVLVAPQPPESPSQKPAETRNTGMEAAIAQKAIKETMEAYNTVLEARDTISTERKKINGSQELMGNIDKEEVKKRDPNMLEAVLIREVERILKAKATIRKAGAVVMEAALRAHATAKDEPLACRLKETIASLTISLTEEVAQAVKLGNSLTELPEKMRLSKESEDAKTKEGAIKARSAVKKALEAKNTASEAGTTISEKTRELIEIRRTLELMVVAASSKIKNEREISIQGTLANRIVREAKEAEAALKKADKRVQAIAKKEPLACRIAGTIESYASNKAGEMAQIESLAATITKTGELKLLELERLVAERVSLSGEDSYFPLVDPLNVVTLQTEDSTCGLGYYSKYCRSFNYQNDLNFFYS